MTTVASFEIPHTAYLDTSGHPARPLPAFARERDAVVSLYRAMVLTRTFDAKAIALQRTGRLGTYPSCLGQEAVAVGLGAAMSPDDVLLPYAREQGAQFLRGVTPTELFLYWGGDERGSDFGGPREDFPICVPVATQAPHAVGVALAFQLRGEPRVAVCVLGDGGTSKGDFYEALNVAGAWRLPAVFVVTNNQWAISLPRTAQTAATTLAQKAIAAGFSGEQVDGNDVIAVRDVVHRAVAHARDGAGPHLVEALTYRLSDHTTADNAQSLPRRRIGRPPLARGPDRASARPPDRGPRLDEGRRGSDARVVRGRRGPRGRGVPGHAAAAAGGGLRLPV